MLSRSRLAAIARQIYIDYYGEPVCRKCGKIPADVHHVDRNKANNAKGNLRVYCRRHHITIHNHAEQRRTKEYYPFYKEGSIWLIKKGRKTVYTDDDDKFIRTRVQAKTYARILMERDRGTLCEKLNLERGIN